MSTNKPLQKFRDKGISLSLWKSRNGGYQVKVEKSYKPKDSPEWKKTDSYFPDELERLEKLCADARRWIHEQGTQSPHEIAKADGYAPVQTNLFDDDLDIVPF